MFDLLLNRVIVSIHKHQQNILKELGEINKKVLLYQKLSYVRFIYKRDSLKKLKRKLISLKIEYDQLHKWEALTYKYKEKRRVTLEKILSQQES